MVLIYSDITDKTNLAFFYISVNERRWIINFELRFSKLCSKKHVPICKLTQYRGIPYCLYCTWRPKHFLFKLKKFLNRTFLEVKSDWIWFGKFRFDFPRILPWTKWSFNQWSSQSPFHWWLTKGPAYHWTISPYSKALLVLFLTLVQQLTPDQ